MGPDISDPGAAQTAGADEGITPASDDGVCLRLPDDVTALFRWAGLKGVRYRDFSAVRRVDRAEMRHRATLMRLETEHRAKAEAERAAVQADGAVREATERARLHAGHARVAVERNRREDAEAEETARERALVYAERMSRQAAAERAEAARRAEALRAAEHAAREERMEMVAARGAVLASSEEPQNGAGRSRKVAVVEAKRLLSAPEFAGAVSAPEALPEIPVANDDMLPSRRAPRVPQDWTRVAELLASVPSEEDSGESLSGAISEDELEQPMARGPAIRGESTDAFEQYALAAPCMEPDEAKVVASATARAPEESGSMPDIGRAAINQGKFPSWIVPPGGVPGRENGSKQGEETLQRSRQRVASRWYALREVFGAASSEKEELAPPHPEPLPPLLTIFSVAGGVGKTTLAASVTRALASLGERVLLVDATGRGVLPYFFGARSLRTGVVRTFVPPSGHPYQPVHMVSYGGAETTTGEAGPRSLEERLRRDGKGFSRVVLDVGSAGVRELEALVQLGSQVLVPLGPDMNSVISVESVRQLCARMSDGSGRAVKPAYLLSLFEAAEPLQLDVRETLQQQMGEALLPFVIRRSSKVGEALAEGMTVVDYAPGEAIAKDYLQVAAWVRGLAEPAREGLGQARWTER